MSMKKFFKKENLMPVIVLLAICLVVAAVLGGINLLTEEKIAEVEEQKVYESIKQALDGHVTPQNIPESAADSVTGMYKITKSPDDQTLVGTVVTVKVKGYAGDIFMTVGIKSDNTVSKVIITSQSESHGKTGMATYPDKFVGLPAEEVGSVDLFTGATVSSTAIRGGVIDAVNAVTGSSVSAAPDEGGEEEKAPQIVSPKTDSELLELADELVMDNEGFEEITLPEEKPLNLIKLYKEKGGRGYVAYVVTTGWGGATVTESLLHVDGEGNIIKHNLLSWNVGHGVGPDDFGDEFVGKDLWNIDDIDLIAKCTGTSGGLKTALVEALEFITKQIERSEKKLLELISRSTKSILGYERVALSADAPESLKMLFKEKTGDGYAAYIVTTGWGGAVVTESLLYIDANGDVRNLDILIWSAGHGIDPGNFADSFKGLNLEELKWAFDPKNEEGLDLVAGCTGNSEGLKDAVIAALEYIPESSPAARIIGLAVLLSAFASVAAIITYKFIKRRKAE